MTGLESQMEEEIANAAHTPNEALQQAQQLCEQTKTTPTRETEQDRKIEEAMHLDQ
jgi:hypothetical protein